MQKFKNLKMIKGKWECTDNNSPFNLFIKKGEKNKEKTK